MPLGKLSKTQIAKGFEVLEEIEAILKSKSSSKAKLNELSNKFYTVIPQDFGRQRPPAIDDEETLQKKYDMLTVLSDIEFAQSMKETAVKETKQVKTKIKLQIRLMLIMTCLSVNLNLSTKSPKSSR